MGVITDHESDASVGTQGTADTISKDIEGLNMQAPKKKLSGAQIRKLMKERKIAAGTWTAEKPTRKSRGKPEVGVKKQTTEGNKATSHEGKKRPRDDSKTPPQPKKWRKTGKPTGSYSEVASEFRMAVIDRRHPEVLLDQGQADLIQNFLVDEMDEAPCSSENPLQFTKTTFGGGVLWMTCANEATITWLKKAVVHLGAPWEGADLTVVKSKDLPKRPRVLVFIPGQEEDWGEKVKPRLEKQNPGLRVDSWIKLSKKTEKEGTIWAFSIDEASFGTLEGNQYRAYYKLGRLTFRVIKGPDGKEDQGTSSEPPTQ